MGKQKMYMSTFGREHTEKSQADIDSFIHEFAFILRTSDLFESIYIDFRNWPQEKQLIEIQKIVALGTIVLYESENITEILKKYRV
jgi:hypothetical protein